MHHQPLGRLINRQRIRTSKNKINKGVSVVKVRSNVTPVWQQPTQSGRIVLYFPDPLPDIHFSDIRHR
jgi:hypothetical protein